MPKPPHYRPIITEDEAIIALPRTIPRTKPTPIPTPSIFEEPTYCFKINKDWAGHFLGVILIGLNQPDTWTPDETHDIEWARLQVIEWVARLLTENDCMPCCDDLVEQLTALVEINNTMLTNITTIVTNLTTVINNQVTQIDNSQTIIDNSETVIEQNTQDLITQITNIYNNQVINNTNVSNLNQMIYDGTPQSISPELGENFNSTGGDDALCGAVKAYIDNVVNYYTTRVNLAQQAFNITAAGAAALFTLITGGLGLPAAVIGLGALTATAANVSNALWNAIASDSEAKRKVYCCMFDSLKDQPITLEAFKNAVLDCGFDPTTFEGRIAGLIQNESSDSNYLAFLRALGQSAGGNAIDCKCCADELILVVNTADAPSVGTVITPLGNDRYRIEQSNLIGTEYVASFMDANGACLNVDIDPLGENQGGIFAHNVIGCSGFGACDSPDHAGVGGFAPITATIVAWQHLEPINTVLKITCCAAAT